MNNNIKFATWNVDQAKREENYLATKFDVRYPDILCQIVKCDADILCVQELRNLETSEINVPRFLYEVAHHAGYDYRHAYYDSDSASFALATFYKRSRFHVVNMNIIQLPRSNIGKLISNRIVLSMTLHPVTKGSEYTQSTLTVLNTHFGLDENEKLEAATFLHNQVFSYLPEPWLCAGDFNFFDDRDGTAQRDIMLSGLETHRCDDLAYPLENASGTFMGYEHDEFKRPFESMSRLDHVFSKGIIADTAYAFGDLERIINRTYPSDHLMIVVPTITLL